MYKNNKKTNNYTVYSADWKLDVYVDEDIFDDPHAEACTKSIEEKIKSLEKNSDFLINPVIYVKSKKRKNAREKVLNSYKILINAGQPNRAEMLRRVFYLNTTVDLASEPLSSSRL